LAYRSGNIRRGAADRLRARALRREPILGFGGHSAACKNWRVDLTVAAIPFYFGSMEAERRWLQRRAEAVGPSPADYTRNDAFASLAMGVGSLLAPYATHALARRVAIGEGRYARALVGVAGAAVVATTVADRIARDLERDDPPGDEPDVVPAPNRDQRRRRARLARAVARAGGVTAVAAGTVVAGATAMRRGMSTRMWARSTRDLGEGPLAWALAVAGWDFIYYWNHRFMHEVRGMWAIHVVHHSSEHYNLSTALRQPVADVLGVFIPYGLLSRFGVRPRLVEQARGINLIYQYWIHTDTIRRIGQAEQLMNTPSHHRVHHGSNRKYIDRNHGSILILWDRLFGTFQREEEPVVYGLTKNIDTYNPARIASHEYRDILRDVADSTNWRDRLSYVLRGPGWAYERHAERDAALTAAS
jgi:sterol desaturase/sphingolipid hydroxylase (fatty acid hydroxylase superfamily)